MATRTSTAGSTPYNETEIVGLITDLYDILVRLGHYTEDEIIRPPPGGHVLDLSALSDDSRIDLRVLSIMQNMLMPRDTDRNVTPYMRPVAFLYPIPLAISRDINKLDYWAPPGHSRLDQSNALPTVLLLLEGDEAGGPSLVLDIADSESCLGFP